VPAVLFDVVTTDVISRGAAEEILTPHRDVIASCLYNAWDHWTDHTALTVPVGPRTRASIVYDYAVAEAWKLLDGRTGISLSEQRRFLLVSVDDQLLLRFKKFRKGLATSGIRTGQQRLFAYQQLTLEGMPAMTHIVAGYLLDEFQRDIARAAITCSVGSRRVWTIDLARPAAGTIVEIGPPFEPAPTTIVRSALAEAQSSESGT